MWNNSSKTPSQLQVDSDRVIDIFTDTIGKLSSINEKIDVSVKQREEEKAKIERELSGLSTIKQKNDKVISRINTFFED